MLFPLRAATLLVTAALCQAQSTAADKLSSHQILPANFKPPQVFKNTNLVRNINLDKSYVRESVNVVIENVAKEPQTEYFIPFEAGTIGHVGGLEVRDKNNADKPPMAAEVVEYDAESSTQFYRVTLDEPLKPKGQQTLAVTYNVLSGLAPLPAAIDQDEKQYLQFAFSEYAPSAYATAKQKTKIKFPNSDVPDYTGKPEKQGSTFTYGTFSDIPAGAESAQTVRYEFTKPVMRATLLERDVEISHWGGNAAFEERYWLINAGANLAKHFDRVAWATRQYYNPTTSAIKGLTIPLRPGSSSPYFTDEIGNISTSAFRPPSGKKDGRLELKPRYPIFGGWSHPFRIGWDNELSNFLRHLATGGYILNVPFLEGPKMPEGISYDKVVVRVILPEGATNVKFSTPVSLVTNTTSAHRTFMDTLGRTSLTLTAVNVADEVRDAPLVVTYDYPALAGYRKPMTIFAGVLSVFVAAWVVGQMDTSIGKKTQ